MTTVNAGLELFVVNYDSFETVEIVFVFNNCFVNSFEKPFFKKKDNLVDNSFHLHSFSTIQTSIDLSWSLLYHVLDDRYRTRKLQYAELVIAKYHANSKSLSYSPLFCWILVCLINHQCIASF